MTAADVRRERYNEAKRVREAYDVVTGESTTQALRRARASQDRVRNG